jgi:hypothetical protein
MVTDPGGCKRDGAATWGSVGMIWVRGPLTPPRPAPPSEETNHRLRHAHLGSISFLVIFFVVLGAARPSHRSSQTRLFALLFVVTFRAQDIGPLLSSRTGPDRFAPAPSVPIRPGNLKRPTHGTLFFPPLFILCLESIA